MEEARHDFADLNPKKSGCILYNASALVGFWVPLKYQQPQEACASSSTAH